MTYPSPAAPNKSNMSKKISGKINERGHPLTSPLSSFDAGHQEKKNQQLRNESGLKIIHCDSYHSRCFRAAARYAMDISHWIVHMIMETPSCRSFSIKVHEFIPKFAQFPMSFYYCFTDLP